MNKNIKYWVWLSSIPGIGGKRAKELLEYFGAPENIWNASGAELRIVPGLTQGIIGKIVDSRIKDETDRHLERIYGERIKIITILDQAYPFYLKNTYDPPAVLYVKGKIENYEKSIAIVGSRKATHYGLGMAETIAFELSRRGITTVSGMARGIDSYAHRGSLKGRGRTIAVLGCGLDIAYPYENKGLMEEIMKNGAVVSEYLPGMPPLPGNFPARNRIISGMAEGVVVIEANEKSGSLITVNYALEQGREVFAVPGNINSQNSRGTNHLIREGAKIVTGIEDILEELRYFNNAGNDEYKPNPRKTLFSRLNGEERIIAECLDLEPMHIDTLAQKTGLGINILNSLLIMMELGGIVEQLPGKIFKLYE